MNRKTLLKALPGLIFISFLIIVYYSIFVREFVSRKYMFSGDTYFHWSLKYMMLYSLEAFGELPWWDPTMYNGYPLYYHFISGWSNYMGPFYMLSLVIFKALSSLSLLTINTGVILHTVLYVIVLIVIALYLISRELMSPGSPAAFLPPFLFCFSYFPLLNLHDFYSHEAMIAPLFYIWSLVRFSKKKTPRNLLLLLFLTGCLLASLCNGIMMSAFFWTVIFTFFVIICDLSMLRNAYVIIKGFFGTRPGKVLIPVALLFVIAGLAASFLPVYYNAGDVIVHRGGSVDYYSEGKFTNEPMAIEKSKIWTVLSNWLPFPRLQKDRLKCGWDGHDHRYMGIITIPLILMALFYVPNRYVIPLLLTYCACNTYIIYSTDNIVYKMLVDNSDFFRNLRNITSILSRGGGHLFLLLLSGIGLDGLLNRKKDRPESSTARRAGGSARLILSMEMLLFLIIVGIGLILYQAPLPVYETTFHIGWYLLISSALCVSLLFLKNRFLSTGIVIGIFALSFFDLTISSSAYIDLYARSSWDDGRAVPDSVELKPVSGENERMFPGGYHGTYHNTKGTFHWGKKAWLVLATTGTGRKILENWDYASKDMKEYPAFRFMDRVEFRPFEDIADIRSINSDDTMFYIHDEAFESEGGIPSQINGTYDLQKYTFNEIEMRTDTDRDGYLYFLDNFDRFWRAYVNGKNTEIYRANFAFKAIRLQRGENMVRWVYSPYPVRNMYRLFYILMALFAGYYMFSSRRPEMREFYEKSG